MTTDAPAIEFVEPAAKKSLLGRIMVPLVMLLVGIGAGVGATMVLPDMLDVAAAEKSAKPKVAPLQYVEINNSFTVNLKDTGRFLQVKIAISTQAGQPVIDALERHEVAVVAAVLDVLADTGEDVLMEVGGRATLRRRMRIAINDVMQRKAGVTGIDDVFLTSFVLQ